MTAGLRPSTHQIDHCPVAGSKARMPNPRYSPPGRSRILSSIVREPAQRRPAGALAAELGPAHRLPRQPFFQLAGARHSSCRRATASPDDDPRFRGEGPAPRGSGKAPLPARIIVSINWRRPSKGETGDTGPPPENGTWQVPCSARSHRFWGCKDRVLRLSHTCGSCRETSLVAIDPRPSRRGRAAGELCQGGARAFGTTAASVSYHVRQLEQQTGLHLFVRHPHKVVLIGRGRRDRARSDRCIRGASRQVS